MLGRNLGTVGPRGSLSAAWEVRYVSGDVSNWAEVLPKRGKGTQDKRNSICKDSGEITWWTEGRLKEGSLSSPSMLGVDGRGLDAAGAEK